MSVSNPHSGERRESTGLDSDRWARSFEAAIVLSAIILAGVSSGYSRWTHNEEKPKEAEFKYAGGTEKIPDGCSGRLEVTPNDLSFACFQYDIKVPYSSIRLMEYRPDVSRRVWKLKPKWKVRPAGGGGKRNHYFTVAFTQGGKTHVMVLEVLPDAMRPYLAEIDLKAGRRVEVMGYENYENNE
ncbi:MAG TPA: hypothetical protein VG204_21630 [Terriglobia bacterium]|nr:hypothetical protein [Terriglobia bacterium]